MRGTALRCAARPSPVEADARGNAHVGALGFGRSASRAEGRHKGSEAAGNWVRRLRGPIRPDSTGRWVLASENSAGKRRSNLAFGDMRAPLLASSEFRAVAMLLTGMRDGDE